MISIYTDGSSHARGGLPGGWAFVIVRDGFPVVANFGGDPSTTNNRMELTGAIKGLETLDALIREHALLDQPPFGQVVELVSDSQYTLGMASGAMSPSMGPDGVRKNGDLVDRIRELADRLLTKGSDGKPRTRWVRGHDGDTYNERCDSLAKRGKKENTNVSSK